MHKIFLGIVVLLFGVSVGYCQEPTLAVPVAERIGQKNLSSCAEKAKFIKKGMTRNDLESLFIKDGGLMGIYKNERYVLRDCACQTDKVMKVNVSFKPSGVSDEIYNDPDRFQAWVLQGSGKDRQGSQDVVMSVSEPYCDYHVSD